MPYVIIEPSGCEEKSGLVKVRFDFYLNSEDKRYTDLLINMPIITTAYPGLVDGIGNPLNKDDYKTWLDQLPHELVITPFHAHLLYFEPDVTQDEVETSIERHIPNFYAAWCQELDKVKGGMRKGWDVETRQPPRRYKLEMSPSEYLQRKSLCESTLSKILKSKFVVKGTTKEGILFPSTAIDIGPGADYPYNSVTAGYTWFAAGNAANATGVLDTWQIRVYSNVTGLKIGTIYGTGGNDFVVRDYESWGSVTSGAVRTLTGASTSVSSSDFACFYHSSGGVGADSSYGVGYGYDSGDNMGGGEYTYTTAVDKSLSIYGTGDTPPVITNASGATNITDSEARLNGTLTDTSGACTVTVYWGKSDGGTTPGSWTNSQSLGVQAAGAVYHDVSDLDAGTTYYYRFYATSYAGEDWANSSESFATESPPASTFTVDIDALLRETDSSTIDLDVNVVDRNYDTNTLSARLKKLGAVVSLDLDIIVGGLIHSEIDIDILLRETDTSTISLDSYIRETVLNRVVIDVLIASINQVESASIDTILYQLLVFGSTVDIDIILTGEQQKRVRRPLIQVSVYRFLDDEVPSVEALSNEKILDKVISCDLNYSFSQECATCSLSILSPLDDDGEYITFEPMDKVIVRQGWDSTENMEITFFGFVDQVIKENPPRTQRLECRDILKLAQNNYYIDRDKKIYYSETVPDELDPDGNPLGGQSQADRQVEAIVEDFLVESGIPEDRLSLDTTNITIGEHVPAEFSYESALGSIQRLVDLIGYKIWADPQGYVQMREVNPIASSNPSIILVSQLESLDGIAAYLPTRVGNIITCETTKDDTQLRNWVTVMGYTDDGYFNISSTVAGDSDYISNPPRYRKVEIRSSMLDTQNMCDEVATRIYQELNRIHYSARVSIEGMSSLRVGQTVCVLDEYTTISGINYFLYDYATHHSSDGWFAELNLVGGDGDGSAPVGNISPVAVFNAYSEVVYDPDGNQYYEVVVDATESYDPDGTIDSYSWVCSGYDNGTGMRYQYEVPAGGAISVTLTVTDSGDPALSDSITKTITPSGATTGGDTQAPYLYYATGNEVKFTVDGGATWDTTGDLY